MSMKLQKWGIKVCCFVDSKSKFVYNFNIYSDRGIEEQNVIGVHRGGRSVPHRVVLRMIKGLQNREHCVIMDNYFTLVHLFRELTSLGILCNR